MACEYLVYMRKDTNGIEKYGCNLEEEIRELSFAEHLKCKGRFYERCRLRNSILNNIKPNKLEKEIFKSIE